MDLNLNEVETWNLTLKLFMGLNERLKGRKMEAQDQLAFVSAFFATAFFGEAAGSPFDPQDFKVRYRSGLDMMDVPQEPEMTPEETFEKIRAMNKAFGGTEVIT